MKEFSKALGHNPQVALARRRINDSMGFYAARPMVKPVLKKHIPVEGCRVLILGLTFKENCPNLRNTGIVDVVEEMRAFILEVDVHDP